VARARVRRVHQVLGALHFGDAVGNEALAIRGHLRAAGLDSEIFAGFVDPRLGAEARPLRGHAADDGSDAACLYHFSPGSPAGRVALQAKGPLAVVYHNVTPARFFAGWSDESAHLAARADRELRELAGHASLGLAKSAFSRRDLEAAGFGASSVLPFVHDSGRRVPPSPVFERLYRDGRAHVLAVGRLAPNKRIEDVLRAFALLQRGPVPRSRLLVVGDDGLRAYADALRGLARALRLRDVVFCGRIDEDELRSAYGLADVLVSLSEHEGYGVPLVEAMLAGVPVVAYDAGAAAETMGGAGVLLGERRPELVAGVIERLVGDIALRAAVLAGQERVAARIRATDFQVLVLSALAPVLETKP
jgi:glycosyltransferase involved in cell wall biosynthesis